MKVLSPLNTNAKTSKGLDDFSFIGGILYMAPHTLSGKNLCPNASPGCASSCLNMAGRGRFNNVQQSRLRKAHEFLTEREWFLKALQSDIDSIRRKALKLNARPVVRLNGTTDIPWERMSKTIQNNPDIQFYDYTKSISRLRRLKSDQDNDRLKNYNLTFSRSEINDSECIEALSLGFNVAVVFSPDKPKTFLGRPVLDGDSHDFRFLDAKSDKGFIIGLKAKGPARRDKSGFVVHLT